MFQNQTPESCIDIFTFRFMCIIESNIPHKTVTVDDRDAPWIQPSLKNLIKKNRKIYSDWKKDGKKATCYEKVKAHQRLTKDAIEEAKSKYMENLGKKLCDPSCGHKTFWTAYKRLANKKKNTNIPPIFENGSYITCFKKKADLFNSY